VSAPILRLEAVTKTFTVHALGTRIEAVKDVGFDVEEGAFVGLTGRSGSGKSTVLKLVYRTYRPQSGSIRYRSAGFGEVDLAEADERTVLALRRGEIGYVSQFLHVVPRTTARDVVAAAALEAGATADAAAAETERLLAHFELPEALWDTYPQTFSGGEKLRLNVARAMVKRPRILLLDEPTASLDAPSKRKVAELLGRLKAEGTTMLGIFHDLAFMRDLADREIAMEAGVRVS
jgi:alpha-D-ribose 1-methylphosphonate 5-triphosphate synthase subunit PhnL